MTCLDARLAIEAAVESVESLDSAASHLTVCARCRSHWEELQALRQELSRWPATDHNDAALRAIRVEVLRKLATRRPWVPRLGWAAMLIVAGGGVIVGWNAVQVRPMPELSARFTPPAAPELTVLMPPAEQAESAAAAPRLARQEARLAEPPEIKIAAVIEPDPETGSKGGMLLELESENPDVVLYLLADNQGD